MSTGLKFGTDLKEQRWSLDGRGVWLFTGENEKSLDLGDRGKSLEQGGWSRPLTLGTGTIRSGEREREVKLGGRIF